MRAFLQRAGRLVLALYCVLAIGPALAEPLARPDGPVILTLSGRIAATNAEGEARFDRAMLERLPQHVLETTTPWDKEAVRYGGVLGRELLRVVGAAGATIKAVALNDYTVTIPVTDLASYDVIFALTRDGQPMKVRDKGPIFVVYPFDAHPELRSEVIYGRSIWQLKSIIVE